jgi:hypothetical protein
MVMSCAGTFRVPSSVAGALASGASDEAAGSEDSLAGVDDSAGAEDCAGVVPLAPHPASMANVKTTARSIARLLLCFILFLLWSNGVGYTAIFT